MVTRFKQKMKYVISIILILSSMIIISVQMKNESLKISEIEENKGKTSKIEIKSSTLSNDNVKLFKKENNENFSEVTKKEEEQNLFNTTNTFELNTEDKGKPSNVKNIGTNIVQDYIILDFDEAKDTGTEYEYYLEENNVKTEPSKIYSESGIKGYCYVIDNNKNNEADYTVNKLDNEPILYSNIEWDKDYYLHIRTCDNNNNYSENLTYKINLPSKGIKIKYLDMNTYQEISPEETLIGNINDEYCLNEYNKNIHEYKLINIDGPENGKLKKERINVKYLYAKEAKIVVKYINKLDGKEIKNRTYIEGYEGKNYNINSAIINGYKYNNSSKTLNGKMPAGVTEIELYYDELSDVNISYINEKTGEKIIPDNKITGIIGEKYDISEKEISGYELVRKEGNENGVFLSEKSNITYYYKKKINLLVKHVDVDTNKVLSQEIIKGYEGDKIIIKPEEFEDYVLNDNVLNFNDDKDKPKNNIIDEILEDEEIEEVEEIENEIVDPSTIQQYDIILGSTDTEYIIYYKRK